MNQKTTVIQKQQIEDQLIFCNKIQAYWHDRDRVPTAYVETYGCQQNEADSERIRGILVESGYAIVHEAEGSDVVVMNTCAIREHAEQRVFGNLGALTHTKRRHSSQKIFLCPFYSKQVFEPPVHKWIHHFTFINSLFHKSFF